MAPVSAKRSNAIGPETSFSINTSGSTVAMEPANTLPSAACALTIFSVMVCGCIVLRRRCRFAQRLNERETRQVTPVPPHRIHCHHASPLVGTVVQITDIVNGQFV